MSIKFNIKLDNLKSQLKEWLKSDCPVSMIDFRLDGHDENLDNVMTKDEILKMLYLSIPDRKTVEREIYGELHKCRPCRDFMDEQEAVETVLDRIVKKVEITARAIETEIGDKAKYCLEETFQRSGDGHRPVPFCTTDVRIDLLNRAYGPTKFECISKVFGKSRLEAEMHDSVAADLLFGRGSSTVYCRGGVRRFEFVGLEQR